MAGKTNKKRNRRGAKGDLFGAAQRALARGNYKQAYKDAKVCYRRDPSEPHRVLYQRACLARSKELQRGGFRAESRSLVGTLMDLGPRDATIEAELPELLVSVGMLDRLSTDLRVGVEDLSPEVLRSAADQAVLHPEEAPDRPVNLRREALRVWGALKSLEEGDERGALEGVRGIGRQSPFADWKLFVRGLAAYYRHDVAEMEANWDRLAPERPAVRIAEPLRVLAGADSDWARLGESDLQRLERAILGESVCDVVRQIRWNLSQERWNRCLGLLRRSQKVLERLQPDLPRRIGGIVCATLVRHGPSKALADLESAVDPPLMDPHWNRAWALAWEHLEEGDVEQAERFWRAYIKDLARMPALSPAERKTAQALVWTHIGNQMMEESRPPAFGFALDEEETDAFRRRAIDCFQKGLQRDPTLLAAYNDLTDVYRLQGDADGVMRTLERLLQYHPQNVEAILDLGKHCLLRDDPFRARELIERARALKPANPEILQWLWASHVGSARHHALRGEWDAGRRELDQAVGLQPESGNKLPLLVRRGLLELKAHNPEEGEQLVRQAEACYAEPTPALLALTIESIRYDLSRTAQRGFERGWRAALRKRVRGQTAGRMCQLMTAYRELGVDYPGRRGHERALLAYLGRCGRVRWELEDLRDTCLFVDSLGKERSYGHREDELLGKLARQGVKRFPASPLFHFLAGETTLRKGPAWNNRRSAYQAFQRAMELWKKAPEPQLEEYAKRARVHRDLLERFGSFGGPGPDWWEDDEPSAGPETLPGDAESIFRMIADLCDSMGIEPEDLDFDDGDGDDGEFRWSRRKPPASRKRRRTKRARK